MKKCKTEGNYLNDEDLHNCKMIQDCKHLIYMEKKADDFADRQTFGTFTERLLFIEAFKKGYIAAFCISDEEEELERTLSPLGKALE